MTYWHMQLHPDEKSWGKEIDVLQKLSVIGLHGDKDSSKVIQFEREMKIGDVVLIKRGGTPLALVEVTGNCIENKNELDWDFDWFLYRRSIKVLSFADENMKKFPSARDTIKKSVDPDTSTYKYIQKWYSDFLNKDASAKTPPGLMENKGVKIREIYISKSKALRDFNVSFLDSSGSPSQIIVIAGINGSGKTTLFEYLNSFVTIQNFDEDDFVELNNNDDILEIYKDSGRGKTKGINDLKRNLYYLPVFDGNLDKLSKKIVTHIDKVVFEDGVSSALAYNELQEKINNIFDGFDLQIFFGGLNRDKNILFRNKSGDIFSLKDLSTGEKVLLSKGLYLHLENDITDSVILVDEPEMSLHPKWQSMIFSVYEKLAREKNNQIIIATHSPQVIANTPYQNLIFLKKEDEKIVPYYPSRPPIGTDVNSILSDFMGINGEYPEEIMNLHRKYRQFVKDGKEDLQEAITIKNELLKKESNDSRFMQEMRILQRLRGTK
jgi:predicted ATP-binding protein involved in virulence